MGTIHRKFFIFCAAVFAVAATVLTPILALAADAFPVPEGDVAAILLNLASNYKTLGVVGSVSLAVLLSVQAIKAFVPENWKYKRLITLAASIVYSIISGVMVPGSSVVTVIVTVLLSSGGAIALYEGLKGVGVIKNA